MSNWNVRLIGVISLHNKENSDTMIGKHVLRCYSLLALACMNGMVAVAGCEQRAASQLPNVETAQVSTLQTTTEEAPRLAEGTALLLEDEPLLLLDEPPADEVASGPVADNSRCFVCHVNYIQESIAVAHAGANIGCADCHGPSDAHVADESWASGGNGTAPEIMYPRDKINSSCMICHPKDRIDTAQHEPLFVVSEEHKVCSDCHGSHRLPQRRCRWK